MKLESSHHPRSTSGASILHNNTIIPSLSTSATRQSGPSADPTDNTPHDPLCGGWRNGRARGQRSAGGAGGSYMLIRHSVWLQMNRVRVSVETRIRSQTNRLYEGHARSSADDRVSCRTTKTTRTDAIDASLHVFCF